MPPDCGIHIMCQKRSLKHSMDSLQMQTRGKPKHHQVSDYMLRICPTASRKAFSIYSSRLTHAAENKAFELS